jgi:uncharacterized protein YndB with AHSA1/START domain
MTNADQSHQPDRVEHRVEHRTERSYKVAATPEQIWDAVATAHGISAWMVPTTLDPKIGGAVSFDLGDFTSTGVVTDYTPNHRFAYEEQWPIADSVEMISPDMAKWFESAGASLLKVHDDLKSASLIATEFLVESGSGGSSVLRIVTSAYGSGAEWENEFFAEMARGWSELLDNLAAQLNKQEAGG